MFLHLNVHSPSSASLIAADGQCKDHDANDKHRHSDDGNDHRQQATAFLLVSVVATVVVAIACELVVDADVPGHLTVKVVVRTRAVGLHHSRRDHQVKAWGIKTARTTAEVAEDLNDTEFAEIKTCSWCMLLAIWWKNVFSSIRLNFDSLVYAVIVVVVAVESVEVSHQGYTLDLGVRCRDVQSTAIVALGDPIGTHLDPHVLFVADVEVGATMTVYVDNIRVSGSNYE